MSTTKLLLAEDTFVVEVNGETSEPVPYGTAATVESDGRRYIGIIDDPDNAERDGEVFELTTDKPRRVLPVRGVTFEDVELEIETDDGDEADDEETGEDSDDEETGEDGDDEETGEDGDEDQE